MLFTTRKARRIAAEKAQSDALWLKQLESYLSVNESAQGNDR